MESPLMEQGWEDGGYRLVGWVWECKYWSQGVRNLRTGEEKEGPKVGMVPMVMPLETARENGLRGREDFWREGMGEEESREELLRLWGEAESL